MRDAALLPPARQDLPILVAGSGPRMLELTARHADAWNGAWFGRSSAPRLVARMGTLDEATQGLVRQYQALRSVALARDLLEIVPHEGIKQRIASVNAALKKVALGLVDQHLRHCVLDAVDTDPDDGQLKLAEATMAVERLLQL